MAKIYLDSSKITSSNSCTEPLSYGYICITSYYTISQWYILHCTSSTPILHMSLVYAYKKSWGLRKFLGEKNTSIWMKITPVQCRANSDDSLEALLYNVNTNWPAVWVYLEEGHRDSQLLCCPSEDVFSSCITLWPLFCSNLCWIWISTQLGWKLKLQLSLVGSPLSQYEFKI